MIFSLIILFNWVWTRVDSLLRKALYLGTCTVQNCIRYLPVLATDLVLLLSAELGLLSLVREDPLLVRGTGMSLNFDSSPAFVPFVVPPCPILVVLPAFPMERLSLSLRRPYSPSFLGGGMWERAGDSRPFDPVASDPSQEVAGVFLPSPSLSRPYSPSRRSLLPAGLCVRRGRGKELGGRLPERLRVFVGPPPKQDSCIRCCCELRPCFSNNRISSGRPCS